MWGGSSRHRFWCVLREKNSFDSNYYMDFCILKFVKLLIKSPKIVLGAFVANIDRDRRPCVPNTIFQLRHQLCNISHIKASPQFTTLPTCGPTSQICGEKRGMRQRRDWQLIVAGPRDRCALPRWNFSHPTSPPRFASSPTRPEFLLTSANIIGARNGIRFPTRNSRPPARCME